jgi:hypothetical protein
LTGRDGRSTGRDRRSTPLVQLILPWIDCRIHIHPPNEQDVTSKSVRSLLQTRIVSPVPRSVDPSSQDTHHGEYLFVCFSRRRRTKTFVPTTHLPPRSSPAVQTDRRYKQKRPM